jgi:non-heme chloroperoxidase
MRPVVLATSIVGVAILAGAPLWAPRVGLGPPPLPAAGQRISLPSGYHLNVIDEGTGAAVILVHGLPGSAYDWQPLPERLRAAGFRVIRYDRVGYGHSDRRRTDGEHHLDANARELLELIAMLELHSPIVAGWSYGGGVALRAAAESPSAIGAIGLIGSIGPTTTMGSPRVKRVLEPVRRWALASGLPARAVIRLLGPIFFSGGAVPAWWPSHALAVIAAPGALHTWHMEETYSDASRLVPERIGVPTVIIHGTADNNVAPATAGELHGRIRGSRLLQVEGGSHMLPNTHAELVVQALKELVTPG